MISNDVLKNNLEITLDVMNNCIDVIYELVKASYPDVYRPALYLSNDTRVNAYADHSKKRIIVNLGLILGAAPLISRYQQDTLTKYHILQGQEASSVQSGIRVHLWRFVILHELYHLWNGHSQWKLKYRVNENGKIVIRTKQSLVAGLIPPILSEANKSQRTQSVNKGTLETNITNQALELDADSSAVCMLINLLFFDMKNRDIEDHLRKDYIKEHLAYIMAALSSTFCLFDRNSGEKFELLDKLGNDKHPIPAIRFVYAEEIADACLQEYIKEEDLEFDSKAVWFDKKGKSLKGWTNPATGKNTAIRSDKMPLIVGQKPGRNDPCPCGSGQKYKKCCGK